MLKPRPPRPLISSTILGSRGNNLSSRRFLAAVPFANVVWLLKVDTDDLDAMSGADRVLSPPLTFIFIEVLFRAALPGFEMKTHSDGRRWQNSTKSGFFISIAADDDDMHLIIMGLAFPLLKFRLQNFGRIEFQIVNEIHRDDGFTSKTFQSNKPNLSQMDGTTIKLQILSTAASGQKHIPQNLVESPKRIWITHTEKLTYRLIRKLSSTVVCTHSRLIFPKSLTPPNSLGCGIWQKGETAFLFFVREVMMSTYVGEATFEASQVALLQSSHPLPVWPDRPRKMLPYRGKSRPKMIERLCLISKRLPKVYFKYEIIKF